VVFVDSMHKRIGPGTGLGFIVARGKSGTALLRRCAPAAGSDRRCRCICAVLDRGRNGRTVADLKRKDAHARQALAAEILGGARRSADRNAFHLWLELPPHWLADVFVRPQPCAASPSPASAFAVASGKAPNAVRIAISAPPLKELERGLNVLRELLAAMPNEVAME